MGGLLRREQKGKLERVAKQASTAQTSPPFSAGATVQPGTVDDPGSRSPSPHLQGTHVFKTADRSSLVTVILQELSPVETQDQCCGAERRRAGDKGGWEPKQQPL